MKTRKDSCILMKGKNRIAKAMEYDKLEIKEKLVATISLGIRNKTKFSIAEQRKDEPRFLRNFK